ncbi:MAG: AMP-binding protein, partial [Proteobacteria bacterium]|nr:AMP-binding protein [Pseudomonadota bacterium]
MGKNLFALLDQRLKDTPDHVYLNHKEDGVNWTQTTWREFGEAVDRRSRALIGYGIQPGDKISMIGSSSPKWFVTDVSIMTIGAIIAPIYFSNSGEQIAYILKHSEVRLFFVEDMGYFQRVEPLLKDIPNLEKVVLLNGDAPEGNDLLMDLESFDGFGETVGPEDLATVRESVTQDMVATHIYTSGTTGPPKAVMLTQKNYYAAAQSGKIWQRFLIEDKSIAEKKAPSMLSLAHVFERNASLLLPTMTGVSIYFGDIANALGFMVEIQSTVGGGPPRTLEKMHEFVMVMQEGMPDEEKETFDWGLKVGLQYNTLLYEKKAIPPSLEEDHAKAREQVIQKIIDTLGFLSNIKHFMTGGAVSSREIIDFFFSIGIWVVQVYGQTEALGMGSVETDEHRRFGSVGKPFPHTEIKIAGDGEILLKSDMVAAGYYKDPKATAETFVDGWLHSGDLGRMDEDGFLFITGRKKDIIITSGAKNVSPAPIEAALMSCPLIEHAVVVGDGKKYLTALLTVCMEGGGAYAQQIGAKVDG